MLSQGCTTPLLLLGYGRCGAKRQQAVATPAPEAPTEPERAGTGSIEGDRTAFHQMFSILERH